MSDSITIEGMEFYAYHGVFPEEKKLGQKFIVDLVMDLDLRQAGKSDRLEDSINYPKVISLVESIVCSMQYNLLEALAEKIADEILEQFSRVQKIRVKVKKPHAPIPIRFSWVAMEIERDRDGI